MSNIDTDLSLGVLRALAGACGFSLAYDRTPGVDEWTLSAGHGEKHIQHVGTRQGVCAFLAGYSAMRLQTTQILHEVNEAHLKLITDIKMRIGSG